MTIADLLKYTESSDPITLCGLVCQIFQHRISPAASSVVGSVGSFQGKKCGERPERITATVRTSVASNQWSKLFFVSYQSSPPSFFSVELRGIINRLLKRSKIVNVLGIILSFIGDYLANAISSYSNPEPSGTTSRMLCPFPRLA